MFLFEKVVLFNTVYDFKWIDLIFATLFSTGGGFVCFLIVEKINKVLFNLKSFKKEELDKFKEFKR